MYKSHYTLDALKNCIESDCCEPPVIEKSQIIELINRITKLEESLNV